METAKKIEDNKALVPVWVPTDVAAVLVGMTPAKLRALALPRPLAKKARRK